MTENGTRMWDETTEATETMLDTMTLPYAPEEMPLVAEGPVSRLLASARVRSGLSVEDIAQETRFPSPFVAAIENAAYTEFAAPIYLIGAVRAYARAVGLPCEPVVSLLRQELIDNRVVWRRQGWIS